MRTIKRTIKEKLNRLAARSDFRANPIAALGKRVIWRLRWKLRKDPWMLRLRNNDRIAVHSSGAGALIYYQGVSEPDTLSFLETFLRPGMVFVDIGAHLGEYTLVASRIVGSAGEVHAFEPLPGTVELLEANVRLNELSNVKVNRAALCDRHGDIEFEIGSDPTLSSIRPSANSNAGRPNTVWVPCMRLDTYFKDGMRPPDLIKVDVEGAEQDVLVGSDGLPNRPVWIFEFFEENIRRFGYEPQDVIDAFTRREYEIFGWNGAECIPFSISAVRRNVENLIAVPREGASFDPRPLKSTARV